MVPRRRMLAVIDQGSPSEFPVVLCYLGIFLRDHWTQVTAMPWWTPHDPDIRGRLEVDRDLLRRLDLDWVPCSMVQPRSWRETHRLQVGKGHVLLVSMADGSKMEIQKPPIGGGLIGIPSQPLVRTPAQVEESIPVRDAAELRREGYLDYVEMLRGGIGSDRFMIASLGSPFWRALSGYFGFRSMLVNLRRDPRLVECVLERIVEERTEKIKAYARAGVDGIWFEECLTSAAEISREDYRRFVLPYNRQLAEAMHKEGVRCIYYPCGDVRDRIDAVLETGMDCISLEESKKGFDIDIGWLDQAVSGRAGLLGNLSSIGVLAHGTSKELREEIRRQIGIGRRHGRFIMSVGSPVTPATSVNRVAEYVRISREESRGG